MQASMQVQAVLQHIEKTLGAQPSVSQGLMPGLVALYDWSMRSQRDIINYISGLGEYLREGGGNVELAIPADLAADLTEVLTKARELLAKTPDDEAVALLLPRLTDAIEAVADAAYDESAEDEEDETPEADEDDALVADDDTDDSLVEDEEK